MNSTPGIWKRKNSNRISRQDLAASTEDVNELLISPKKRNRIPEEILLSSGITERKHRIGAILSLPEVHDGIIRGGEEKNVEIFCTLTENKMGRTLNSSERSSERSGSRFIYLADCTGFLSLYVDATKVGICQYDIDPGDCTNGETRLFFNVIITGDIAWRPTRESDVTVSTVNSQRHGQDRQTFFLNNGLIQRIELDAWSGDSRFMLPTTDVCLQMVKSRFGSTALFGTTGICGRVDQVIEKPPGVVVMSLEDPVGYSAIEIHPLRDDETATSLIQENNIVVGTYLFVKGKLEVRKFPQRDNASLKMNSTEGTITEVGQSRYADFVRSLCAISPAFFKGIAPEDM